MPKKRKELPPRSPGGHYTVDWCSVQLLVDNLGQLDQIIKEVDTLILSMKPEEALKQVLQTILQDKVAGALDIQDLNFAELWIVIIFTPIRWVGQNRCFGDENLKRFCNDFIPHTVQELKSRRFREYGLPGCRDICHIAQWNMKVQIPDELDSSANQTGFECSQRRTLIYSQQREVQLR